jgi:serine/threonine-protein kinase RsbT
MIPLKENALGVLKAIMSPILAKSILSLSESWAGVDMDRLRPGDIRRLMEELEKGINLYVPDPETQRLCLDRLREIMTESVQARPEEMNSTMVAVREESDIVTARAAAREVCVRLDFSLSMQVKVATAISELARNIVQYAGRGEIIISSGGVPPAIEIIASDQGPGIADVDAVMSDRYKSKRGMGIGLKGTRNLMDEFSIESRPGEGCVVRAKKYY